MRRSTHRRCSRTPQRKLQLAVDPDKSAAAGLSADLVTRLPEGYGLQIFNAQQPFDSSRYAMKWDGEWHITIEVFRDLGIAFAAVLVLIYILVVGWFQRFGTPLTIMTAIPFSLVGILPAHALMAPSSPPRP